MGREVDGDEVGTVGGQKQGRGLRGRRGGDGCEWRTYCCITTKAMHDAVREDTSGELYESMIEVTNEAMHDVTIEVVMNLLLCVDYAQSSNLHVSEIKV